MKLLTLNIFFPTTNLCLFFTSLFSQCGSAGCCGSTAADVPPTSHQSDVLYFHLSRSPPESKQASRRSCEPRARSLYYPCIIPNTSLDVCRASVTSFPLLHSRVVSVELSMHWMQRFSLCTDSTPRRLKE